MKRLFILISWAGFFSILPAQDFSPVIHKIVPNVVDIRSLGMGKTGSAGNVGSNAIFGNPSLIALQQNASIKLGSILNLTYLNDEYTDKYNELSDYKVKHGYKPNYKFSHISAAFPFHIDKSSVPFSFAFGAGYHNAIDLSSTRYLNENSITLSDFYQHEETDKFRGGLNTISPAIAFGFFNRISAGVSFNIGFGNTKNENTSATSTIISEDKIETNAVIPGNAFSTSIGITGKLLKSLTLGANITPPYKWTWDKFEVEKKGGYPKKQKFAGGEFTIPLHFSIGCEYQLADKFAIAFEYQTRPFESYELDADKAATSSELSKDLSVLESIIKEMNLKNGHVFHAGVELSIGYVPFRFGFFLEPYPLVSEELKNGLRKSSEKPNNVIGGTFGFSSPISSNGMFLELAAQYGLFRSTFVDYNLSSSSAEFKEYEKKEHRLRFDLGFRIDLPSFSSNKSENTGISAQGL
jgi:hypothetical protein